MKAATSPRAGAASLLAALLFLQAGPASAAVAFRAPASVPAAGTPAVNPLIRRWSQPLQTAVAAWDGRLAVLPGGALTASLADADFSHPAEQRRLVPLLRTLEEMGLMPEQLAANPKALDDAAAYAQEQVRADIRKRASRLAVLDDEEAYRGAKELLRDLSAYEAYLDPSTLKAAEKAYARTADRFRDNRRGRALSKLKETADRFLLNLHDPAVMDWVLREDTRASALTVSPAHAESLRPFATLPDPETIERTLKTNRSGLTQSRGGLTRAPPETALNDHELERAIERDFKADNAASDAVEKIQGVAGRFAEEAARLLELEAFVMLRGHALQQTAQSFSGIIRSHLEGENYLQALRRIRGYADEAEENPRARRWIENLAKYQARKDYDAFDRSPEKIQNIAFLPNPLAAGEYWDLAAGPHAASLMRNGLSANTKYVLFDISHFVVAYLKETRRLLVEDGVAHAENIEILERDLTRLEAPGHKLAVIRAKNVYGYIPGFEKRFEELSSWLKDGGQLILPMDRAPPSRMHFIHTMGDFVEKKIAEGWGFEYSFAGAPGAHDEGFDHVVLTKPQTGARASNKRSFDDFKREALAQRHMSFFSLLFQ